MRKLALSGPLLVLVAALGGCGGDSNDCTAAPGVACVWAGNGALGFDGDGKPARESRLYWPEDVEFAPDGTPWILDWNNHLIRKVTPDGKLQTVVGSFVGDGPPDLSDLAPPGARGDTVSLNHPTDIQFAPDGTLIFAAWHNHKLRVVNPTTGLVTVMCGRGGGFAGDGVVAGAGSLFNQPKAIVRDPQGAIYILDQRNFRIRKIDPAGMLSTVVGKGTAGFSGDGGPPLEAELRFEAGGNPEPSGALALGPDGALYISDGLNHRIRRVDFVANTINTIAGNGVAGFSGDGGPSLAAQVNNVRDMEFGPDGRLYLADSDNNRIRALDLQAGTIAAVAGTGLTAPALEGKPAAEINLNRPFGVAFDAQGNLYISDTFNSRVLKVTR